MKREFASIITEEIMLSNIKQREEKERIIHKLQLFVFNVTDQNLVTCDAAGTFLPSFQRNYDFEL